MIHDLDITLHPYGPLDYSHQSEEFKKIFKRKKKNVADVERKHKLVPGFVMSTNQIHLKAYG